MPFATPSPPHWETAHDDHRARSTPPTGERRPSGGPHGTTDRMVARAHPRHSLPRHRHPGAARTDPRCIDDAARGGGHRVPGRRVDRNVEGRRSQGRRLPRAPRPRTRHVAHLHGAVRVHDARPQSRALGQPRGPQDRLHAGLRCTVHPRHGEPTPPRHARRLPQLRQARLHGTGHAHDRRRAVRADGRAGAASPPGDDPQPAQAQRQAADGVGHLPGTGRTVAAHDGHRVRPRRGEGHDRQHVAGQLQLTAGVGQHDARRGQGLRRIEPGDAVQPVRARRCQHPGQHGRCRRAAER